MALLNLKTGTQIIGRGLLHQRLGRHKLYATRGDTILPIYTIMHNEGFATFRIEVVYVQEKYDARALAAMEKTTISERAAVTALYNRHQYRKQTETSKRSHMLVHYSGRSARNPRIIPKK